jgi:chaperonin cofactor prefoldin
MVNQQRELILTNQSLVETNQQLRDKVDTLEDRSQRLGYQLQDKDKEIKELQDQVSMSTEVETDSASKKEILYLVGLLTVQTRQKEEESRNSEKARSEIAYLVKLLQNNQHENS